MMPSDVVFVIEGERGRFNCVAYIARTEEEAARVMREKIEAGRRGDSSVPWEKLFCYPMRIGVWDDVAAMDRLADEVGEMPLVRAVCDWANPVEAAAARGAYALIRGALRR